MSIESWECRRNRNRYWKLAEEAKAMSVSWFL